MCEYTDCKIVCSQPPTYTFCVLRFRAQAVYMYMYVYVGPSEKRTLRCSRALQPMPRVYPITNASNVQTLSIASSWTPWHPAGSLRQRSPPCLLLPRALGQLAHRSRHRRHLLEQAAPRLPLPFRASTRRSCGRGSQEILQYPAGSWLVGWLGSRVGGPLSMSLHA